MKWRKMKKIVNNFGRFTVDCMKSVGESVLLGMWF